jgi:hypothetical protein
VRTTVRAEAATIAFALAAVAAPAASAVEPSGAVCRFETHETTTEGGNWITPGSARNETLQPGTITCVGSVGGKRLAERPGTISYWYVGGTQPPATAVGGENCVAWGGHGEMIVNLPLAAGGHMNLTGGFTARGVGLAGVLLGHPAGTTVSGPIHFRPEPDQTDQDCVRKPYNHFIANGEIVII